jgi:hypothetical protein
LLEHPVTGEEGGVSIENKLGRVIVKKSIFFGNASSYNGAIFIKAPYVLVENSLFTRNTTFSLTSGILNITVVASGTQQGRAIISNNTIYGNFGKLDTTSLKTTSGVGLNIGFNNTSSKQAFVYVYNNIIYNNGVNTDYTSSTTYKGLQVYIDNTRSNSNAKENVVFLYNNDIGIDTGLFKILNRDLKIDFSTGQSEQLWITDTSYVSSTNLYNQSGNMSLNPKLSNPFSLDPSAITNYTDYSGYKLTSTSPVIDKGYVSSNPNLSFAVNDIEGDKRPLDGDGDGTAKYDIGFDEYNPQNTGGSSGGDSSGGSGSNTYNTLTLTITKPTYGNVKSSDNNINCGVSGNICSKDYNTGTKITLEAIPINGYKFDGWNGVCTVFCNGVDNPCTFTLPTDTNTLTCEAVFIATANDQNGDNQSQPPNNNSGNGSNNNGGDNSGNNFAQTPADDNTTGGGGCSMGNTSSLLSLVFLMGLLLFRKFNVKGI